VRTGIVALILLLLLALAALGGGWKWTHHSSPGPQYALADDSTSLPDGWTWDS
jgi:O-antigen ligase